MQKKYFPYLDLLKFVCCIGSWVSTHGLCIMLQNHLKIGLRRYALRL